MKNQDSIQFAYTFGPFFVLFYRTILMLFYVCLRLVENDENRVTLLNTLNKILFSFNLQTFEQKVKNWDAIAKMKQTLLDFQLEIKNSLDSMVPKANPTTEN